MIITLNKSKGTCVGNDNRDISCFVSLILQHVLNLVKQTPFLVYFASFFWSYISTSDLKGMLICICDFGKYAAVREDSVGHVASARDLQSGGSKSRFDLQIDRFTGSLQFNSWTSLVNRVWLLSIELNHLFLVIWVGCLCCSWVTKCTSTSL